MTRMRFRDLHPEHIILGIRGSVFIFASLFVLSLIIWPSSAVFTVNAKTNALTVIIAAGADYPQWGSPHFVVTEDAEGEHIRDCPVKLYNRPHPPVIIDMEMVDESEMYGSAIIAGPKGMVISASLRSNTGLVNKNAAIGEYECDKFKGQKIYLPFKLLFRPTGTTTALAIPLQAEMQLGRVPQYGNSGGPIPQKLLIDGKLFLEASSWPSQTGQARAEVSLNPGDLVQFCRSSSPDSCRDNPSATALSSGFVQLVTSPIEGSYLQVVARSEAKVAVVTSYQGVQSMAYAPSLWERLQAMGDWAAIIALATLAIGLLDLSMDFVKIGRKEVG